MEKSIASMDSKLSPYSIWWFLRYHVGFNLLTKDRTNVFVWDAVYCNENIATKLCCTSLLTLLLSFNLSVVSA